MPKIKLLPCPFCGAKAELLEGTYGAWVPACTNGFEDAKYTTDNCIAYGLKVHYRTRLDAAEFWNKRVSP